MDSLKPERCTAKSKRTGLRCGRWPIKGTTVCANHGGLAPQVKAAAQRNLMAGELRSLLERHGRDVPITDPLTALQQLAGRARAWLDFLEERVSALRHGSQWDTEQIRGEVQLFVQAQGDLGTLLTGMAKLKIDERLVAIEEAKVKMLFDALKIGLAAGGVTGPGPTQAAWSAMGRHLRVIQGGGEGGPAPRADEDGDEGEQRRANPF